MASEYRQSPTPLEEIFEKPFQWDFFQALRKIECMNIDKPRIGDSRRLKDDALIFAQKPKFHISSAPIEGIDEQGRMEVNFLGLTDLNGPIPLNIKEHIFRRSRNHADHTLEEFLNIFNHRLVSLYYKAWSRHQLPLNYDRPQADNFLKYIGSLSGIASESMQSQDSVEDTSKLYYSGRLSSYTSGAEGLSALLMDYFNVPVKISPFSGEWLEIPPSDFSRLGSDPESSGLGTTMVLGSRVWECQSRFRIDTGPLDYEKFCSMLPSGTQLGKFKDWVKSYCGVELSWDLCIILKKEDVPKMQLGQSGALGWTSWLGQEDHQEDCNNLVLGPF